MESILYPLPNKKMETENRISVRLLNVILFNYPHLLVFNELFAQIYQLPKF